MWATAFSVSSVFAPVTKRGSIGSRPAKARADVYNATSTIHPAPIVRHLIAPLRDSGGATVRTTEIRIEIRDLVDVLLPIALPVIIGERRLSRRRTCCARVPSSSAGSDTSVRPSACAQHLQVQVADDNPPRCAECATPPPGPPIDDRNAIAPRMVTAMRAGTGKMNRISIRCGKYIANASSSP